MSASAVYILITLEKIPDEVQGATFLAERSTFINTERSEEIDVCNIIQELGKTFLQNLGAIIHPN